MAAPLSVEIYLTGGPWPPYDKDDFGQVQSLIALPSQEISGWESLVIYLKPSGNLPKPEGQNNPITLLEFYAHQRQVFAAYHPTGSDAQRFGGQGRHCQSQPSLVPPSLLFDTPLPSSAMIPNIFVGSHSVAN